MPLVLERVRLRIGAAGDAATGPPMSLKPTPPPRSSRAGRPGRRSGGWRVCSLSAAFRLRTTVTCRRTSPRCCGTNRPRKSAARAAGAHRRAHVRLIARRRATDPLAGDGRGCAPCARARSGGRARANRKQIRAGIRAAAPGEGCPGPGRRPRSPRPHAASSRRGLGAVLDKQSCSELRSSERCSALSNIVSWP